MIVGLGLILSNAYFVAIEFESTRARQYPESEFDTPILRFQAEHQELALVIEAGEVVGLVTVTDRLEAVTGGIAAPIDLNKFDTGTREDGDGQPGSFADRKRDTARDSRRDVATRVRWV